MRQTCGSPNKIQILLHPSLKKMHLTTCKIFEAQFIKNILKRLSWYKSTKLNSSFDSQAPVVETYHPPFVSNFLFTNLFSIKFLYFFIISSLFPYFNLFVSIVIQSYVNIKLHVSTLLDTNNTPGMQLGRFKNRTPARFEYIYCTLFPLCHSN